MASIWVDLLGSTVGYRGIRYRTRVIEAGSGHPLVLIHGVGGHAEAYSRNVVRLGRTAHVLAMDLLWHGLSSKPPFTHSMIEAYGGQVLDVLDSIGAERADVEGESLGGWVTMWLALNHPDRIRKIILNTCAGVIYPGGVSQERPQEGTQLLRERSLAAIRAPSRETIQKRLEWLMASPERVTEELIGVRHFFYSQPETQAALTHVFENSFGGSSDPAAIPLTRLQLITQPTLVLWSDKNPGNGPDAGRKIAATIPGAQFHCIEDAAHWPQWEQPEEHDRVVAAFLSQ